MAVPGVESAHVSEPISKESEEPQGNAGRGRRRTVALLGLGLVPLILAGGGYLTAQHFGVWPFAPGKPVVAEGKASFIDLPEMTITLPNGGQPRQLRIKLSLEVVTLNPALPPQEAITPKVYDALLMYFRTLHDGEIDGSLALDRLRGELYRRVSLVLGPGVLRDVLITGLVVA
jgi:flagellar FliL protein